MTLLESAHQRVIDLEFAKNFRDLGGYLGAGGSVAWGRLYRSDGLGNLSSNDLAVLDALGIRTVIDLRTSPELATSRFPVELMPVNFHNVSVMDRTWHDAGLDNVDDPVEFLTAAYRDMLDRGADRFAEALALLAIPGAGPVVFHCAAGKDRTGVLAMLLLAALGASDEDIAADYAMTREGMARLMAWAAESRPELIAKMIESPAAWMAVEPVAILRLLASLRAEFGSLTEYLSSIGVGRVIVDDLRDAFLV